MRKKIGAVLTEFLLLVVIPIGISAGEVPPREFFINPETNLPHVTIIVGEKAASEDVVSAIMLAAKVCVMAYEGREQVITRVYRAVHEDIALLNAGRDTSVLPEVDCLGSPTVDVPDADLYLEWEHNNTAINYTLTSLWYFDDSHSFWGNNDETFNPWETHEEIQVRFDAEKVGTSDCEACLHSRNDKKSPQKDLSWYDVDGLIYRVDNIFVPPSIAVKPPGKCVTPPSPIVVEQDCETRTLTVPEPWLVVQDMLPRFRLFDIEYTVVDGGPVLDMDAYTGEVGTLYGTPYLLTGEPHFNPQVLLHKHEPITLGPYTVELMAVDNRMGKAWLEVSEDDKIIDSFYILLDRRHGFSTKVREEKFPFSAYEPCNDLNNNGELDPGEMTCIVEGYDEVFPDTFSKWIVGCAEKDVWADYHWEYYIDDDNTIWLLFKIAGIVIDGVRAFNDDQGTCVEIQVYWLENEKAWYNHFCSDPWISRSTSYQLFLDAYQSGWDTIDANMYLYQPPGTGLWPLKGLKNLTDNSITMFVGNGFLDNNDGHIGYEYTVGLPKGYIPEENDLDRDNSATNDCRSENWLPATCTDLPDVEDPVVWHGPGPIMVEMNVGMCERMCTPELTRVLFRPHSEDPPYFTIEVTDNKICDKDGIDYTTLMKRMQTLDYVIIIDIDESYLIEKDTEFDFAGWKAACDCNLILVGGPVANMIVNQLRDENISTVDWGSSPGEWDYIRAPYNTCDILIVAGKDRWATREAVQNLIRHLTS